MIYSSCGVFGLTLLSCVPGQFLLLMLSIANSCQLQQLPSNIKKESISILFIDSRQNQVICRVCSVYFFLRGLSSMFILNFKRKIVLFFTCTVSEKRLREWFDITTKKCYSCQTTFLLPAFTISPFYHLPCVLYHSQYQFNDAEENSVCYLSTS